MKHRRGGGRSGWDRLRHALAPEYHEPEPAPEADAEPPARGPGRGAGTSGEVGVQASLDQVLRHAAEAREVPPDDKA